MAVYALGDLHLSAVADKPMGVFGEVWERHAERIASAWTETVTDDDIVLLPGDLSWAMTLPEAQPDLNWLAALPGHQLMIRGNHDYWWSGIGKVRQALSERQHAIQNDALALHNYAFCGSRGWLLPSHPKFTETDETIYRREAERLRLSLGQAKTYGLPIIALLHYPPCGLFGEDTIYTDLLTEFSVDLCVYGHLHGPAHRFAFEGQKSGVDYRLVSADYVGFAPKLLRQ